MTAWLSILGIGEDGVEGLGDTARRLIGEASLVVGGRRHLALVAPLIRGEQMAWSSPLEATLPIIVGRRGESVAVLASGDPFLFGVGSLLAHTVPPEEMRCVPAPSSVALACACLGWAQQETTLVSICGRPIEKLLPALQPGARLLVLSADAGSPALVVQFLRDNGFGSSTVTLMEALGGPNERVRILCDPPEGPVDPLNLLAIELLADAAARPLPLAPGLPDDRFLHDGQLTKSEIRALTIQALAPLAGETLWDVGAGSGSIGIEWMLRHPRNRAVALERDPERAARARENARLLGVPDLLVLNGTAPAGLATLSAAAAAPDAVFIGGGASVPSVLETCWAALRPSGRLVANAVTIETETALFAAHVRWGGTLRRLSVERLDRVGGMHGFRPAMTVTQYVGVRP